MRPCCNVCGRVIDRLGRHVCGRRIAAESSDEATTKKQGLPLPPVGTRLRDPQGIAWDVIAHEDGRARLASATDPDLRRMATAERLSDFAVVRTGRR